MRFRLALLAALFVLVYPATLLADTYQYTYIGTSYTDDAQFTFTTDALITSATTVTPTSCSYNPGGGVLDCDAIEVDVWNEGDFYLEPPFSWEDAAEIFTGFSLTDIGTQSNAANSLIIADIPSVAATPEPSSIALLGTAMLSFAGIARRRFAPTAPRQTVTG